MPRIRKKRLLPIKSLSSENNENKKIVHEDGSYYIGQIKNGLPDGKGKDYYCDGKVKYEGDFIEGKREGNGKIYFSDGNYYIGEWKNNLQHGNGTLYDKNGIIIQKGYFRNGFYDVLENSGLFPDLLN